MTGLLSQREIEAFKRDGWFVRRSILDPELCRQYDRHPAPTPPSPHPWQPPGPGLGGGFFCGSACWATLGGLGGPPVFHLYIPNLTH